MAQSRRSEFVRGSVLTIEVYVDAGGETDSTIVVLPSFGRNGGKDFDGFAVKLEIALNT